MRVRHEKEERGKRTRRARAVSEAGASLRAALPGGSAEKI